MLWTLGEKLETIDFLSVVGINAIKIVHLYIKNVSKGSFVAFVPC